MGHEKKEIVWSTVKNFIRGQHVCKCNVKLYVLKSFKNEFYMREARVDQMMMIILKGL